MKISIIIPVYNVEKYIERCLSSIRESTYKDFEAIIIDDGSIDNSGQICDAFCKQDNRFIVIHQDNRGVSSARNRGIKIARGDFISFVDSDDCIHPLMLETLINSVESTNCKVSMVLGKKVFSFTQEENKIIPPSIILNQGDIIKNMFSSSTTDWNFCVVWNKIYHKSTIKGLSFNDEVSEDTEFNLRIFLNIDKIAFVNCYLYYYYNNSSSLTNSKYLSKRFIDEIPRYLTFLNYLPLNNKKYRAHCLLKLYKRILSVKNESKNDPFRDYARSIINEAKHATFKEFKNNNYISMTNRIVVIIFLKFPILYKFYRWINEKRKSILK